uniref:Reverse transcriptase Ty1/copia-type domain-containing protein n=1 Tax=Lactuca sativa TaxID=4236 RepID=A0A9R1WJB5_LACSA|nr:hypothetical protein LSAT_V11C200081250 [Lactuca sativa]
MIFGQKRKPNEEYLRERVKRTLLLTKDEVFGMFKEWKFRVEKMTGKQVETLRTVNGLEFCNAPFDNFYKAEGIDYHEVFSPVVKHKTIRVLLAMVSAFDLELEYLDVKIAFLHGNLEEKIYMSHPKGFLNSKKDHVCLLKTSLYGLKQSPRQWYKRFVSFMM